MGYTDVRDAIQTIIESDLVDVTGTSSKVFKRIPPTAYDAHGYSIIISPPDGGFSLTSTSQYNEDQTWTIHVYSPNVGTSYRSEHEDRLLKYADKIITIFANVRTLPIVVTDDEKRKAVPVQLGTIRFNDGDFPVASQALKYHFAITLTIQYSRSRSC